MIQRTLRSCFCSQAWRSPPKRRLPASQGHGVGTASRYSDRITALPFQPSCQKTCARAKLREATSCRSFEMLIMPVLVGGSGLGEPSWRNLAAHIQLHQYPACLIQSHTQVRSCAGRLAIHGPQALSFAPRRWAETIQNMAMQNE